MHTHTKMGSYIFSDYAEMLDLYLGLLDLSIQPHQKGTCRTWIL